MSNRKTMQAPDVRRGMIEDRRRPQQTRGFWEWILGDLWT